MTARNDELEARLVAWAKEYGEGNGPGIGWSGQNLLQTLIDHKGFVPNSRGYVPVPIQTGADEVESIVRGMEASGWFRHVRALRCDYYRPNIGIDQRLQMMRRIGLGMSRTGYYEYVSQAKAFVAGALFRQQVA